MIILNINENDSSSSGSTLGTLLNQDTNRGTIEVKNNTTANTDRNKFLPKMAEKKPLNHLMNPQLVGTFNTGLA